MAAAGKEKEPKNAVHQNAILKETVTKENRHQKLYTNYSINPFKECKYIICIHVMWLFEFLQSSNKIKCTEVS